MPPHNQPSFSPIVFEAQGKQLTVGFKIEVQYDEGFDDTKAVDQNCERQIPSDFCNEPEHAKLFPFPNHSLVTRPFGPISTPVRSR